MISLGGGIGISTHNATGSYDIVPGSIFNVSYQRDLRKRFSLELRFENYHVNTFPKYATHSGFYGGGQGVFISHFRLSFPIIEEQSFAVLKLFFWEIQKKRLLLPNDIVVIYRKAMPKVNDEYLQDKREQILDAAYRVCMQKPVYSITMSDVIAEIGWSQGAIYRYFKNVHYIIFELINRQTAHLHVKDEVDAILSLPEAPECIVSRILDLVTLTTLKNSKEFGKMIFEYTALIGNQPEYFVPFTENVKIAVEIQYLQKKTLEYILSQIEQGYFKPLMPVEDIFAFTGVSIDGIERDLILAQSCSVEVHPISALKEMDPQKLMNVLCKSVIYLLGGDFEKVTLNNNKEKI